MTREAFASRFTAPLLRVPKQSDIIELSLLDECHEFALKTNHACKMGDRLKQCVRKKVTNIYVHRLDEVLNVCATYVKQLELEADISNKAVTG
jgi:hypothetical protein